MNLSESFGLQVVIYPPPLSQPVSKTASGYENRQLNWEIQVETGAHSCIPISISRVQGTTKEPNKV